MAIRSIAQLKAWFKRGKYPTEAQFADWIDSFFHKEEDKMPISSVEGLSEQLNGKYDAIQAQELQKQVEIAVSRAEANQKDIDALYTNVEELEAEDERLDGRITSGDEASLQSANTYTDTAIAEERVVRESAERTTLESAKTYADQKITEVVGSSPEALDTLKELAGALGDDPNFAATVAGQIGKKVDKVEGKGLSTEDYTTADKSKLAGIAAGANNYVHPTSHSADMIEQNENRRFVSDAEKAAWNSKVESSHSVSYAELVALRNGKQLRPGHHYRITDFVTTVANDAEARSAGHPFDIIVLATAADTLSEEARAIVNESNAAYFATANLAAWKVWYCLDNDISRFQWADETNGRGVIYRLIDEWQNDCPYDFKNVQFKRCLTGGAFVMEVVDNSDWSNTHYILSEGMSSIGSMEIEDVDDCQWFFTFNRADNFDLDNLRDASLIRSAMENVAGAYFNKVCNCNTMKPYYTSEVIDETTYVVQALNNIVLSSYDEENGDAVKLYGNIWGASCYNMTFHEHCYSNTFGDDCRDIVGFKFYRNTFENDCYSNTFGNDVRNNTFGNYCDSNTFGNDVRNNTFGNGCSSNTFGNYCDSNTFGNDVRNNTFGNGCSSNTFGNYCWGNTFGNGCSSNTFGNYCDSNTFGNYLSYITVNDGVKYVVVVGGTASNPIWNAQILNGTSGSNDANRLQISFKANVKYCQFAGLNSSGILKIWTPADLV